MEESGWLYLQGKDPRHSLNRKLVGVQSRSRCVRGEERRFFCPYRDCNCNWIPPVCSLNTITTELPGLPVQVCMRLYVATVFLQHFKYIQAEMVGKNRPGISYFIARSSA